ncbi:MAG: geranylgeranyl reductase family protein [Arenicella sp.]|jgi:geranylgeranyl reductase family protein
MQNIKSTDIFIVGAGPGGVTASMWLSKHEIPHTIIDKAVFPRDKICGDAISGKVYSILKQIEPEIWSQLGERENEAIGTFGVSFSAPNGKDLDIYFSDANKKLTHHSPLRDIAPGFVMKRLDFDDFLFKKLNPAYATIKEGVGLKSMERNEKGEIQLILDDSEEVITPKIVIGADGERSLVNKTLTQHRNQDKHFAAAVRAYYTNVTGMKEGNLIELHYIDEAIPGYLWVFPLPNGGCNVGMGMLSSKIKEGKRNLRKELDVILKTHPKFKDRFKDAELDGKIQGWGLPLGSKKRVISGDGYMLTGDAASLIDPLTGEGIGNAIISGKYAAVYAMEALEANDFSAKFFKRYDKMIYYKLWNELKISHGLQLLATKKWLINFLFRKATGNEELQRTISMMFADVDMRKKLWNPLFYFRILFG